MIETISGLANVVGILAMIFVFLGALMPVGKLIVV
jgi:hypothetical protein